MLVFREFELIHFDTTIFVAHMNHLYRMYHMYHTHRCVSSSRLVLLKFVLEISIVFIDKYNGIGVVCKAQ